MPINSKYPKRIENYKKKLHFCFHPFLFDNLLSKCVWKIVWTRKIYNVKRKGTLFYVGGIYFTYKKEKG